MKCPTLPLHIKFKIRFKGYSNIKKEFVYIGNQIYKAVMGFILTYRSYDKLKII